MDKLINKKQCKAFALRWAEEKRLGWQPTQVSAQFLQDLESKVRLLIQGSVHRHPSIGKTIKDFC